MHCHMTHHLMNQMGHDFPNMIGANTEGLEQEIRPLLPGYMTMGEHGMGDMAEHAAMGHMPMPDNSIPMSTARGQFGTITMGGMFTIVKIRENLASYDEPGWYDHPAGTVADVATSGDLSRDGITLS